MLKRFGILATLVAASGLFMTAAYAAPLTTSGGPVLKIYVKSDTDAKTTSSTTFINFASLRIVVPSGAADRLVIARFSAESQCYGSVNWCSVQLIARLVTTTTDIPFNPNSGFDFAFDTDLPGSTDDYWESHSMERWVRLPPGTYDTFVQWRVITPTTIFRLDDWTYRLDVMQ